MNLLILVIFNYAIYVPSVKPRLTKIYEEIFKDSTIDFIYYSDIPKNVDDKMIENVFYMPIREGFLVHRAISHFIDNNEQRINAVTGVLMIFDDANIHN